MKHTNRLIHEKSPYLLQHAHNPVDWYPWGSEAFEKARQEDKPIFLSIGYSTCYWCHVMERDCFEQEDVAQLLNGHFVSIKVDREERPDIDQIYMLAVQLLTGSGGWPMSTFLTAEGKPFFGGTYFPRERFQNLLAHVSGIFRARRSEVERAATEVAEAIAKTAFLPPTAQNALDRASIIRTLETLREQFDTVNGGFGHAPKFPPHNSLPLLLHAYRRTHENGRLFMVTRTLEAMALGGIHDHMGGGFHRYATDANWFLPHFEKMLYDNALLSRSYVEAYLLTDDPLYRRTAERIFAWVEREMTSPQGAFYSALDAESEGIEGKFYLWTEDEIYQILGGELGELFCRVYNITPGGNYHEEATGRATGENIPFLQERLFDLARRENLTEEELEAQLEAAGERLLKARGTRTRPHLDDKILTSWNGLMIGSLAYAGQHLNEPRYTAAAENAANFVLSNLREGKRLLRRWREGEAKLSGYLDDYAFFAQGLLELHEATKKDKWLQSARELVEEMTADFWDQNNGGFFFSAQDAEPLFIRLKDPFDSALPSGNAIAAQVLLRLKALTGEKRYYELARQLLEGFYGWLERAPQATQSLILAAAQLLEGEEAIN